MRALMHLVNAVVLWARRISLRSRIAQLQALLARPDLMLYTEALPRALYEARLAELRAELYALEASE